MLSILVALGVAAAYRLGEVWGLSDTALTTIGILGLFGFVFALLAAG